jgi:hypothetical protein
VTAPGLADVCAGTCSQIMIGEFDFTAMHHSNRVLTPILLIRSGGPWRGSPWLPLALPFSVSVSTDRRKFRPYRRRRKFPNRSGGLALHCAVSRWQLFASCH